MALHDVVSGCITGLTSHILFGSLGFRRPGLFALPEAPNPRVFALSVLSTWKQFFLSYLHCCLPCFIPVSAQMSITRRGLGILELVPGLVSGGGDKCKSSFKGRMDMTRVESQIWTSHFPCLCFRFLNGKEKMRWGEHNNACHTGTRTRTWDRDSLLIMEQL